MDSTVEPLSELEARIVVVLAYAAPLSLPLKQLLERLALHEGPAAARRAAESTVRATLRALWERRIVVTRFHAWTLTGPCTVPAAPLPEGATVRLLSPLGRRIVGTRELIPGTAWADTFAVQAGGGLDPEYQGETEIDWDGQVTQQDERIQWLYEDEDGETWPEDQLQRVLVELPRTAAPATEASC